ncbi:MAG TPA: hypothetical protein VFY93_00980 [Planctomycetota bacterium]|nr:hypothetical protein [Planctomycetota bacterium]
MKLVRLAWCAVLLAGVAGGEDLLETLNGAAAKLGVELKPATNIVLGMVKREGAKTCDPIGVFRASLTSGLTTCDRIDIEVSVADDGSGVARIAAYPRVKGELLEPRRAADKAGIMAKLGEPCEAIAPLSWVADAEVSLHAACSAKPDEIERALLKVPAIDAQVADLLPLLKPALTDDQVKERLKAAGAETDESKRNSILLEICAYLPDVETAAPGQAAFQPITMNRAGVAFDAFRFRVPGTEGERRLAWAFAIPPGVLKGWFIAPMGGDAQKFVKFHRGGHYAGVPAEHAALLQRSETPLKAGAEYVLWFGFKVDTPVEMKVALSCIPYDKADRDAPSVIEKALGLKAG